MKSCQVMACVEFSKRFLGESRGVKVTSPQDVLPFVAFLKKSEQECFAAVSLDAANQVLEVHSLTMGLVNQTPIHPREAFRKSIQVNAVGLIFVHNHPSGNVEPSQADLKVTEVLVRAGELLGVAVLDHLIVSDLSWKSIKRSHPECWP